MIKNGIFVCAFALATLFAFLGAQDPPAVQAEVPIGGIIIWWGRAEDIPYGFEACDGTAVTTKGAVFKGKKPDLQSKFPRGIDKYRSFAPQAFSGGGNDRVVLDVDSFSIDDHVLTDAQLPSHQHGMDHVHYVERHTHDGVPTVTPSTDQKNPGTAAPQFTYVASVAVGPATQPTANVTSPTSNPIHLPLDPATLRPKPNTDLTGSTRPVHLTHKVSLTATPTDNRPAFLDVVFLLRVK